MTILMIIGAVLLRLVPHLPNFAPITALALFGGTNLGKRFAIFVPFSVIALSDYLLLYINPFGGLDFSRIHPITGMFHSTTIYVWGSFVISGLIGIWLQKHKRPAFVIVASLLASLQFFLLTNFGVWAGGMYSRGMDGLMQSYIMGLPFFRWTLLGDLFYTVMFFGTFELALRSRLSFSQKVAD